LVVPAPSSRAIAAAIPVAEIGPSNAPAMSVTKISLPKVSS
jgi:hypothetical protein